MVDFVLPPCGDVDQSLPPRTSYFKAFELDALTSSDNTPVLIVLHGLSGGSHQLYLRHVLLPMIEAGWEACVINARGCAKSKVTTGLLYNARATWDMRQIFPSRPLFGLGFSLGANMLVNVLTLVIIIANCNEFGNG